MKKLNFELRRLCERNRDGSYGTQEKRIRSLQAIANSLDDAGYRKMGAQSLKPKHVEALVARWKEQGLTAGTIKNYMTSLRWWSEKIGKQAVIARDNDHYGIERRVYVTGKDRSVDIESKTLREIKDSFVRMSVELQRAFGLRREEAIKFQPAYAMLSLERGCIQLKDTWTKGGKHREIPLTESRREYQMDVLRRALALAGKGSLIPTSKKYVDQLRVYERRTADAGLSKLHGLRHAYAQSRYQELTGWQCPAKGGPGSDHLTPREKEIDRLARLRISKELGHERIQIVAVYLGGKSAK